MDHLEVTSLLSNVVPYSQLQLTNVSRTDQSETDPGEPHGCGFLRYPGSDSDNCVCNVPSAEAHCARIRPNLAPLQVVHVVQNMERGELEQMKSLFT